MKYFLPFFIVLLTMSPKVDEVKIKKGKAVHSFSHIPYPYRERNYKGGSCVHASNITALRFCGKFEEADFWRANYAYGEYAKRLAARMAREGFPAVLHTRGSKQFLEDCSLTRRPAVIGYGNRHSQLFCGFEDGYALILDNNRIGEPYKVPKEKFIRLWRGWGGWAVVPLGHPAVSPRIWE